MAENNLNSLYPHPPEQTKGLLNGSPAEVIGVVSALNNIRQQNAKFGADQAIGQAYTNALQPDGSIDQNALAGGLKRPEASFGLPEAASRVIAQRGGDISNTTAQLEQHAKQQGFLVDALGALADDPKLTYDKVRNTAVTFARNLKLPGSMVNSWLSTLPRQQGALKETLNQMRNVAIGSSGTSASHPTVDANGAPISITKGEFLSKSGQGGVPAGLAPGEAGLAESAAGRAATLQSSASTAPQYHADLDNLKQLSKVIDIGGPTVPFEKNFAQLASRFGLPSTLGPEQLKGVEEFDKIANQISLNQSKLFHGSDAGLHTVVGANPSTSMSKYGREGVIDMLQGNQDAIDITRKAWLKARANGAKPGDYDMFAERMGQELDPRVFQFNRLNRANQQKFLSQMDPSELKDFEEKFKSSVEKKWVKPLKAPDAK
jgi:hypothetical protein